MRVDNIDLRIIADSRGQDTLQTVLKAGDIEASAGIPSGKSIGATEAYVLPPSKALDKPSWLISQLRDHDFASLEQFDHLLITLDGTENKKNLGGNLMLALSMAFARLLSYSGKIELFELLGKISGIREFKIPLCLFNVIEGGVHAENSLPFQEYLFVPETNSPKESLNIVSQAIDLLKKKIFNQYSQKKQGDEGGFSIPSDDLFEGFRILSEIINENNFRSRISLDAAASTLKTVNGYKVGERFMTTQKLLDLYEKISSNFHPLSIEDPFDEEDWEGFSQITSRIGDKVWIVGDDLLTTNVGRIKKAYEKGAVNAVLIKPNQIGTISETIMAANLAKGYGWKTIVSHRSGETMDTFIADLAVGIGADGLKSGSPLQKERLVKYERLIEIEKICQS